MINRGFFYLVASVAVAVGGSAHAAGPDLSGIGKIGIGMSVPRTRFKFIAPRAKVLDVSYTADPIVITFSTPGTSKISKAQFCKNVSPIDSTSVLRTLLLVSNPNEEGKTVQINSVHSDLVEKRADGSEYTPLDCVTDVALINE